MFKFDETHERNWMSTALRLLVATMAYNAIEAVVAIWSGTEADSIALLG